MLMKKRFFFLFLLVLALCPLIARAEDGFLYSDCREAAVEHNLEKGPWYYHSAELALTVCRRDAYHESYVLADIQSGGPAFYSGFAEGDVNRRSSEMPSRMARRYSAVLGVTGDYLRVESNPKGAMIRDGAVYYDGDTGDTLAVLPDGSLAAYPAGTVRAQELLDLGVKDSFAFGPILVLDGAAYEPALTHRLAVENRRTCLAQISPGHTLAMATNTAFTNAKMQEIFLGLGVDMAYSLDGGHSTAMVFMGEQLNRQPYLQRLQLQQRALGDMVFLGESALCPDMDDPQRYGDPNAIKKQAECE